MTLTAAQDNFCNGLQTWLRDPEQEIKPSNAAKVLKTVKFLMSGQGVASTHRPGPRFLGGFKFDPHRHSALELRELGKEWLPLRRPKNDNLLDRVYDSTNGWVVDHAAGYLQKYAIATGQATIAHEMLPPPPPPPTTEQIQAVANRPWTAGGARLTPKRKPRASKKRSRTEEELHTAIFEAPIAPIPAPIAPIAPIAAPIEAPIAPIAAIAAPIEAPIAPTPAPIATPIAAPIAVPKPSPKPSSSDLKRPEIPDLDVQEARILFRNAALVKHLRTHPLGDWIKNPHRKIAGRHTLDKTKEKAADAIKNVIREWLLTTPAGRRALAAADVGEGELSIDRVFARHDRVGMGLNSIFNLYILPVRHNSYFGAIFTTEKRNYVGERAYKLAKEAHEAFVKATEAEFDWDAHFVQRATFLVNEY